MASKLKIPPGPTPVVDNGQVAINAVMMGIGPLAVALRFWARSIKKQRLLWDDWTIFIALIINTALSCHGIWAGSKHFIGYVIPFMKPHPREEYKKSIYVDVLLCHLIYGVVKISVVLFYRRIFFVSQRFNVCSQIYLGFTIAWMITAFFGQIFCSGKPSDFWSIPVGPLSTVINYGAFLISMLAIDLALDVIVLLMPGPAIRNLTMSWKRKLQILAAFGLGAFCLVAGSVRVYYAYKVLFIVNLSPYERTRMSNLNHIWGHIEATFSIVAACLPTIIPVFTRIHSAESIVGMARKLYNKSSSLLSVAKMQGSSKDSQKSGRSSGSLKDEKPSKKDETFNGSEDRIQNSASHRHDLELGNAS